MAHDTEGAQTLIPEWITLQEAVFFCRADAATLEGHIEGKQIRAARPFKGRSRDSLLLISTADLRRTGLPPPLPSCSGERSFHRRSAMLE